MPDSGHAAFIAAAAGCQQRYTDNSHAIVGSAPLRRRGAHHQVTCRHSAPELDVSQIVQQKGAKRESSARYVLLKKTSEGNSKMTSAMGLQLLSRETDQVLVVLSFVQAP